MTSFEELKRMLEGGDHGDAAFPDLPAIIGRGRRLRRRRRAGMAVVAAACSLAIAVPVGVRVGTDDGRGPDAPVSPTPDRDTKRPDAKQEPKLPNVNYGCRNSFPRQWPLCHEGSGIAARPLGAVVDTGAQLAGVPIMLFAESVPKHGGRDESTRIPVLTVGYLRPATGRLERFASLAGQVGPEAWPEGQQPDLVFLMATTGGHGPWVMAGAVTDPDVTAVTAVEADGSSIKSELSKREVAPGMRVFWASGDDYTNPQLPSSELRLLDADGNTLVSCVLGGGTRGDHCEGFIV